MQVLDVLLSRPALALIWPRRSSRNGSMSATRGVGGEQEGVVLLLAHTACCRRSLFGHLLRGLLRLAPADLHALPVEDGAFVCAYWAERGRRSG